MDGEVVKWLCIVDSVDDENIEMFECGFKDNWEIVWINYIGEKLILIVGMGLLMMVVLLGKGKDFEVVGILFGKFGFYVVELVSLVLGCVLFGCDVLCYVVSVVLVIDLGVYFKWGCECSFVWVM